MTKDDFVELSGILRDRPRGSKILKIMFEFSEDPEHGLYLSAPWIEGESFTMSGIFQETLKEIFRDEELDESGEDSPQHILITIMARQHSYSILLVESQVIGADDRTLYLYKEEDFS